MNTRVELTPLGKEQAYPRSRERKGTIIRGDWPNDQYYKVHWDYRVHPENVHRKYLREIDE